MTTMRRPTWAFTPVVMLRRHSMMVAALRAMTSVAGLLVCASASASDYIPRDLGNWTVAPSEDGQGCFLTRVYDHRGETTLLFGIDRDGANHLSVLNANWSIKPKDRLSLDFRLSKGGYSKHFAVGMASDGKRGFVTSFEAKFPDYLAASRMLDISRGDVPVERLTLDGSGAAVAEMRRCVEELGQKSAAKTHGKSRSGDIPKDPFADRSGDDAKK